MSIIDSILRRQRPFASRRSARRYRRHPEGLPDEKKAALLNALKKDGATFRQYQAVPAPARGWQFQQYQHG